VVAAELEGHAGGVDFEVGHRVADAAVDGRNRERLSGLVGMLAELRGRRSAGWSGAIAWGGALPKWRAEGGARAPGATRPSEEGRPSLLRGGRATRPTAAPTAQ
jgi:hypothetical protein